MTPDKEKYYADGMRNLADLFQQVAGRFEASSSVIPVEDLDLMTETEVGAVIAQADPELLRLRDAYLKVADELFTEFQADGYSDDEWNDLMSRSGLMESFGFGDGAAIPPAPAP